MITGQSAFMIHYAAGQFRHTHTRTHTHTHGRTNQLERIIS